MSIDINWETITSGPDGDALAEKIRAFIDEKFQQITLPRFIRSVRVQAFDFGKICPELEIKDICDPLPDFYEEDDEESGDEGEGDDHGGQEGEGEPSSSSAIDASTEANVHKLQEQLKASDLIKSERSNSRPSIVPPGFDARIHGLRSPFGHPSQFNNSPFRSGTPGIPGGTSNLSYFHLPLGGISGTQTPLAAVASGWPDHGNDQDRPQKNNLHFPPPMLNRPEHTQQSGSPVSRPSTGITGPMSPESLVPTEITGSQAAFPDVDGANDLPTLDSPIQLPRMTEKRTEDVQVVCHVKYSGDIRMTMTAEILLDYPMQSFVGIPFTLSITGLTFDGVAVLAYIRKRAHFCFLSPEDAHALVGADQSTDITTTDQQRSNNDNSSTTFSIGGLLQEIKVESEIGKRESGKQALKNVSKVEKFVLEQVRRIFEDEFVFPSFWTFLV